MIQNLEMFKECDIVIYFTNNSSFVVFNY